MCGRYAIFTEEENQEIREIISEINERYTKNTQNNDQKIKTGEIFPTDLVPVITGYSEYKRTAELLKWGFPNYKQPGGVIINARSESLLEKPTFRNLVHTGNCLVPASGFYEWNKTGTKKEKFFIRSVENNMIYFAGLYKSFIDKDGLLTARFVIITTDANEQMSKLHNRMPVILDSTEAINWVIPNTNNSAKDLTAILKPYEGELIFQKVG